MTPLQHLSQLADAHKQKRSPNFPAKYIPRSKYSDKDAGGLTKSVVDYASLCGHFATRLQSTGTYRDDIKRFVGSQQRAGLPDVFIIVNGHAVFCEIKIGKDNLSDVQKQAIADLERAGASVFIARNFDCFYDWFNALQAKWNS